MEKTPALPDPWRVVRTLEVVEQDALESSVGSRLTYADLGPDDVSERDGGKLPRSRRSWFVMGHRWLELENMDAETKVLVRLQASPDGDGSVRISSAIFPFQPGRDLSGTDLRSLPVAALNAALSKHEQEGTARMHITLALGGADHPPAGNKLPPASATDRFAALVALQYLSLESEARESGVTVARRMAELNQVPLSTVQRWISRARKRGFLPPPMPRGHGG